MKEWLTAREIAAEALPSMPATESGIIRQAERENWDDHPFARKRQGRGGGMEYRYLILPALAQIAYVQKHKIFGMVPEALPVPANDDAELTPRAKIEQAARLSLIAHFEEFRKGMQARSRSKELALHLFAIKYNNGSLQVDASVRGVIKHISKRTLARWIAAKKSGRSSKLGIDRSKARAGTGVLDLANDGAVKRHVLGLIAHQPHLSGDQVRTLCRAEFGDSLNAVLKGVQTTVDMPPLRTFQHFLKGLKETHKTELLKLTNPDRYRSTMLPSGTGTLKHVTEPNALWQIDASPVDALCTDGRHSVYVCIDIATRRFLTYISRTPRAAAVGLLIRKAILAWGVPDTIKTDNGSDFTAEETKRLFLALNITPDLSDAYSPAQKGHVERAIKTYQHDFVQLLPGYVGHSVADRKAIEDRKSFADRLGQDTAQAFGISLSGADLQSLSDEWCMVKYAHAGHDGLGGKSPFMAAAASATPVKTVAERALDVLLMPVAGSRGSRKVTKFGITIDHFHYRAGFLLPGHQVFVRLDPNDKGRIYVFTSDQAGYLGEAICSELAGIHPQTYDRTVKQEHAELIKRRVDPIRAEIDKIVKGPQLIRKVLDVAARDVPNVVAMPKREVEHTTPQIAAAIDAVTPRSNDPKPLNEMAAQLHAAIVREAEFKATSKVIHLDPDATLTDRARKFKWALAMEERIASGDALDDAEAGQLVRFQATGDYQSMRDCLKDFGLENTLRMF